MPPKKTSGWAWVKMSHHKLHRRFPLNDRASHFWGVPILDPQPDGYWRIGESCAIVSSSLVGLVVKRSR